MKKKFLQLMIVLIGLLGFVTNSYSRESTLAGDTIPKLSNDVSFRVCYNSLVYWWNYAQVKDSIEVQNKAIIEGYEKITGIQTKSVSDLEEIYQIKAAIDKDKDVKIEGLEKELKKVNRGNKLMKIGIFVLPPAALIGGIALGVKLTQ